MNQEERAKQHRRDAVKYLYDIKHLYAISPGTGLYEPNASQANEQSGKRRPAHVDSEWPKANKAEVVSALFTGIGVLISIATLIGLLITVMFTVKQWDEAHRTADASVIAARASQDASDTAADTLRELKNGSKDSHTLAESTKSAADTANRTMRVSQRAYITTSTPGTDFSTGMISMAIVNNGRIPSRAVSMIIHEETDFIDNPEAASGTPTSGISEFHWQDVNLSSVSVGAPYQSNVFIPRVTPEQITSGHQLVFIMGVLTYNDGFSEDGLNKWSFCWSSRYVSKSKQTLWSLCDPVNDLARMIKNDEYPNKQHYLH